MERKQLIERSKQFERKPKLLGILGLVFGIVGMVLPIVALVLPFVLPFVVKDYGTGIVSVAVTLFKEKNFGDMVFVGAYLIFVIVCVVYIILSSVSMINLTQRKSGNVRIAPPAGFIALFVAFTYSLKNTYSFNSSACAFYIAAFIISFCFLLAYRILTIILNRKYFSASAISDPAKKSILFYIVNYFFLVVLVVTLILILFVLKPMDKESTIGGTIKSVLGGGAIYTSLSTAINIKNISSALIVVYGVVEVCLAVCLLRLAATIIVGVIKAFLRPDYVRACKYFSKSSPARATVFLSFMPLLINGIEVGLDALYNQAFDSSLISVTNIVIFAIILLLNVAYSVLVLIDKKKSDKKAKAKNDDTLIEEENAEDESLTAEKSENESVSAEKSATETDTENSVADKSENENSDVQNSENEISEADAVDNENSRESIVDTENSEVERGENAAESQPADLTIIPAIAEEEKAAAIEERIKTENDKIESSAEMQTVGNVDNDAAPVEPYDLTNKTEPETEALETSEIEKTDEKEVAAGYSEDKETRSENENDIKNDGLETIDNENAWNAAEEKEAAADDKEKSEKPVKSAEKQTKEKKTNKTIKSVSANRTAKKTVKKEGDTAIKKEQAEKPEKDNRSSKPKQPKTDNKQSVVNSGGAKVTIAKSGNYSLKPKKEAEKKDVENNSGEDKTISAQRTKPQTEERKTQAKDKKPQTKTNKTLSENKKAEKTE